MASLRPLGLIYRLCWFVDLFLPMFRCQLFELWAGRAFWTYFFPLFCAEALLLSLSTSEDRVKWPFHWSFFIQANYISKRWSVEFVESSRFCLCHIFISLCSSCRTRPGLCYILRRIVVSIAPFAWCHQLCFCAWRIDEVLYNFEKIPGVTWEPLRGDILLVPRRYFVFSSSLLQTLLPSSLQRAWYGGKPLQSRITLSRIKEVSRYQIILNWADGYFKRHSTQPYEFYRDPKSQHRLGKALSPTIYIYIHVYIFGAL